MAESGYGEEDVYWKCDSEIKLLIDPQFLSLFDDSSCDEDDFTQICMK